MLRGWTRDVTAFTNGAVGVAADARAKLDAAGVRLETTALSRLRARDGALEAVELADGTTVPCDALFVHPLQTQVELVNTLGLGLDDDGYVRVDPATYETSVAGIYAAGDLMTRMQGATIAAAAGTQAAAAINLELTAELATPGARGGR
jgi:thioredoxin reductase